MNSFSTPRIIAHRGSHATYPEQSRAAYLVAIAEGADALECDVHLTKDRKLVCTHDDTTQRLANVKALIAECTLAELKDMDFSHGRVPARGTADPMLAQEIGITEQDIRRIITLEELINICEQADRSVGLVIETKHPSPFGAELDQAVIETLDTAGWIHQGLLDPRVEFMSFFPDSLEFFATRFPQTPAIQLIEDLPLEDFPVELHVTEEKKKALMNLGEKNIFQRRYGGFGLDYLETHTALVQQWMQEGVKLRCFTVNTEKDLALLARAGNIHHCEAIITDTPGVLRKFLEQLT